MPILLIILLLLAAGTSVSSAETITSGSGNLVVAVNADGTYGVTAKVPGWQLTGTLPGKAADISSQKDRDDLGEYQQLLFTFVENGRPMSGSIRLYNGRDIVLFSQTSTQASATAPAPFPDFTTLPQALDSFSYQDVEFAPPRFGLEKDSGPWLFFDTHDHAMVISPASHLLCASMVGDGKTELGSGFDSQLKDIPALFTQQTFLVVTQGINHAWETWGHAMTIWHGKTRPANDADTILKYFGYWTDNGAAYWYNYDFDKGYQATLEALLNRYRAEHIPIHYLQLDSWWYRKTLTRYDGEIETPKNSKLPEGEWNRYGGTIEYKAHPFIFPEGLEAFHGKAGLPFITHNRWIDPASPYHQRYRISGIAAIDPGFWEEIIAYLKKSGVIAYEQDWLSKIFQYSPGLSSTVDEGEEFLDGMASACKQQGLSIQYCMATPRCFLQGSKYDNLTTIRVSDDRFVPARYHDFLYTSRLACALGIWPWTDVCRSTEINNLLLSNLSAGPVGTGDAIGEENKDNLLKAMRADGVIIKPDAALLPVDGAYIAEAEHENIPLVATTYTRHDELKTLYCAAVKGSTTGADSLSRPLRALGCVPGTYYCYDYFAGTGEVLDQASPLLISVKGRDVDYIVIAPIGSSGMAFLGDADKFVGTGRERVASLRDEGADLTADVILAANEQAVTLKVFAPAAPVVAVQAGEAGPVKPEGAAGLFTVDVKPDMSKPPEILDGDSIRRVKVIFRR